MKLQLNVKEFKKFNPPLKTEKIVKYIMYAQASTMDEEILNNWTNINPRTQDINSSTYKKIINTLENDSDNFYKLNRGITLSANNVTFNNSTNIVELSFEESEYHGCLDGAHTLRAIIASKNILDENCYVTIEIFENLDLLDSIIDLCEARNTSTKVDEKSLENLRGTFVPIKNEIEKYSWSKNVYYFMNENKRDKQKTIDILKVLSIYTIFNDEICSYDEQPIFSYNSKSKNLGKWVDLLNKNNKNPDYLENIYDISIKLYEAIEKSLDYDDIFKMFNSCMDKKEKNWINKQQKQIQLSTFNNKTIKFKIPEGIVLPILNGFKGLLSVDKNTNKLTWKVEPLLFWEKNKNFIFKEILDKNDYIQFPTEFGKNKLIWNSIQYIFTKYIQKEMVLNENKNPLIYKGVINDL